MNWLYRLCIVLFALLASALAEAQQDTVPYKAPGYVNLFSLKYADYVIEDQELEVKIIALDSNNNIDESVNGLNWMHFNDIDTLLEFNQGIAIDREVIEDDEVVLKYGSYDNKLWQRVKIRVVPAWISIIPALIAIAIALLVREVVTAIFGGIFIGAWVIQGITIEGFFRALGSIVEHYIMGALYNEEHLPIIIFSILIGGMVAIINRNGGMAGVVEKMTKYANSPKNSQLITYLLGISIFFDDYANTLIVGNTMRPITDLHKVSREKLAYIVDSTAAPVAATAFVTTWIGSELSYIAGATETLGIDEGAYSMFLNSLQFAYYPIFCLIFMLMLILLKRDFGAMLSAENRARETGVLDIRTTKAKTIDELETINALDPLPGVKYRWYNAIIPILTVLGVTFYGLISTGLAASGDKILIPFEGSIWNNLHLIDGSSPDINYIRRLGIIVGNANAYLALMWATLAGVIVAVLLTISQRLMPLTDTIDAMLNGFKTMVTPILILIMAWALAAISDDLYAASFLSSIFTGNIPYWVIPSLTLVLAAFVAFSTGSSWGTMAILYPLMLPTTWSIAQDAGLDYDTSLFILYQVISAVLAGAVLGDHCSPISDTTILSSLASDCNHIQHVKTQLPYALSVAGVALFCSLVLINLGIPWYLTMLFGTLILFLVARFFGKEPVEIEEY